ncbi:IucA/IucC family protein [Legionella maioricensis]|uniref:Siderophore biosynthesis protein n=1 Tax=Legionella maioricensis TaxID=2896528 RepID=A0A9X2IAZ6_9GAMM|nr:IucA/IucC family protein [Legionella maioricensis]MCL9683796.1 siderophore biosynthesis protein [Legionella maioricensis]MCL9686643.1 siderophore biosynthesis protein [Legionella maioricensis]
MALAYGNFHELSHQLRFLLFEIGIGLPQSSIDYFITLAHKNALQRLQHSALMEGLINSPIASHHVHDFIDQLQGTLKRSNPASQFYQWKNIRDELDESIANHALALAYKQRWDAQICCEASQYDSLWSWINSKQTTRQAFLFLEQWGYQGHPSYPGFRAKMGFTRREVLQNSPEFQAKISLHWCALSKNQMSMNPDSIDLKALIAREFPHEFKLWQEKLKFSHINPEEYIPVPVHPWQWRNKLQITCSQLTDSKSLILLPHHQTVIPSMSVDTMMPIDQSNTLIKLAINDHARDLNEQFYGCTLSRWINSLLTQSGHYQNTLFLANDLAGLNVDSPSIPKYCQKELSVKLLQHPVSLIKSEQKIVPLMSLFAHSPLSNKPLLIEMIKESGLTPINYFNQYCHKVLSAQLHLLLKYGVAFEALPHNTLLIFSEQRPQGLILRDLEQIKIAYSAFFEDNDKPDLPATSRIKTSSLDKLRTVFIHGTLQNNLGHWINSLTQEYQLDEQQLWHVVYQVMQTILNELAKEIHPSILSWQKHQLLHDTWQHQCSLTMRLRGTINKDVYRAHPNPLNTLY